MISQKYPMIAAAVTVALGASGYASAVPSLLQAAAAPVQLVIAGSSAAEGSVAAAVENNICGGVANTLVVQSKGGSGNFFAFSCNTSPTTPITGVTNGTLVTIYYRTEGGSVVGALPIVQNKKILRLNLADATNCASTGAATGSCTVTGLTATAGTTDSWGGGLTQDFVQLGVTDVEPSQLTNADFPSNYSPAVFGTATTAQLKGLQTSRIFDQVFGLAVNTTGGGFPASSGGVSNVSLSKEAAANILTGSYSDWSAVPDAKTFAAVASTPVGITRIDREPGSGTRTATNIFFLNYQCGTTNAIQSLPGEQLNFSTADELTQANGIPGAVAYTSIDQILNPSNLAKWPNLALVSIDGVTPSTQAAAAGAYGFWFEATFVPNTTALGSGTGSAALATFLENSLPTLSGAPSSPDIDVIPSYKGNVAAVPLTGKGTGTTAVFVNVFSRLGNSCNVPAEQN